MARGQIIITVDDLGQGVMTRFEGQMSTLEILGVLEWAKLQVHAQCNPRAQFADTEEEARKLHELAKDNADPTKGVVICPPAASLSAETQAPGG